MAKLKVLSNILTHEYNGVDYAPGGKTIDECYEYLQVDPLLKPYVRAFVRGGVCHDWGTITVEGDSVIFAVMPAGGDDDSKGVLAAVAMVAVLVFAQWAGPALAANLAGGAAVGAVGAPATVLGMHYITAGAVITSGIGIVGSLAIGAIFKPSIPGMNAPTTNALESFGSPTSLIVGQSNQLRQDGIIPKIFGQHIIFPDIVAQPYVDKRNCSQVLHAIYCLGNGIVEMEQDSIRLGGVPWSELQSINPGMAFKSWVGRTGAVRSTLGYNGRRFFQSENKVITKYDDTLSATIWTYADFPSDLAGDKMFFNLTYPQGIYTINQALNKTDYYESKLAVQVLDNIGGQYRNLVDADFYAAEGASQIICTDDNGEAYLEGEVVENAGTTLSFGVLTEIVEGGDGSDGVSEVELNVSPDKAQIFGLGSASSNPVARFAGWNGVFAGHATMPPLPNMGVDNGKNSMLTLSNYMDADTGVLKHLYTAYAIDPAVASNIYYMVAYSAFDSIQDGGSFKEGTFTAVFNIMVPREVNDQGSQTKILNDIRAQVWMTGYDAHMTDSSKTPLALGAAVTVQPATSMPFESHATTLVISRKIAANSPHKIIQFGCSYDVAKTTSRRGAISVASASFIFRPSTESPGIQTDAKVIAKFPSSHSTGTGVSSPKVGDVLYFAGRSIASCAGASLYCFNLPKWYTDISGYKTIQSLGIAHRITSIAITGAPIVDGSITYQKYTIEVDNPITESPIDSVYLIHSITPGIKLKAKYTSPIHFGLELKMFAGVRFGKTETQGAYDQDTVQLTSTEVIQETDVFAYIRDFQNITYTFLEIKVPANDVIGQTLKPLSCSVMGGARDRSAEHYNADLPDQDPANKNSAVAVYDENPAWAYLNIMTGAAGGRPLRLHGSIAKLTDTVDLEAFRRWADFCTEHDFRFSYVITGYSTIGELLNVIAGTGRGRPTFRDGKHSIIFDGDEKYFEWWTDTHGKRQAKAIVRQIISPENSWNGTSKMEYLGDVHGLRVSYLNKHTRKTEFVDKYLPGFAEEGTDYYSGGAQPWQATKMETMNMPGVAYQAQVETLAEYYIKQVQLRRERIVRTMDVEALISHEGDIVSVVDDVMRLGGKASKIVEIFSDDLGAGGTMRRAKVRLDDPIPAYKGTPTPIVGIKIRHFDAATGQPKLSDAYEVELDPFSTGSFDEIAFSHSVHVGIQVRTMALWGIMDKISQDYQIAAISYSADMTATLELLEYYPDPLYYDGDRNVVGETPTVGHVPIPKNVTLEILWNIVNSESWSIKYVVNWDSVPGLISTGGSYMIRFTEQIKNLITQDTHITTRSHALNCDDTGGTMGVRVFAIDAYGNVSNNSDVLGVGYARVVRANPDTTPPDVTGFNIELGSSSTKLTWTGMNPGMEHYLRGYVIRHSPSIKPADSSWELNTTEIFDGGADSRESFTHHRVGTFYIKAKGMCGAESTIPAVIISDIADDIEKSKTVLHHLYDKARDGELQVYDHVVTPAGASRKSVISSLRIKGTTVKIGSATDCQNTEDWPNTFTSNMISPIFDEFIDTDGQLLSTKCFVQEDWIIFDPNYGVSQIPRNNEIFLTEDVKSFAIPAPVTSYDCPSYRHPDSPYHNTNTVKDLPYYKTWLNSESTPLEWTLITGGIVAIKDHLQIAIKQTRTKGSAAAAPRAISLGIQYAARTESGDDIPCTVIGIRITYNRKFHVLPSISILAQDLRPGDTFHVTSKTTDGFTIRFYNSSGNAKTATFDWIANGYGVG